MVHFVIYLNIKISLRSQKWLKWTHELRGGMVETSEVGGSFPKATVLGFTDSCWWVPAWPNLSLCFYLFALDFTLFYVSGCFVCMYTCAPRVCLMPEEARRGCWELQVVVSCLEDLVIKPRSSGSAKTEPSLWSLIPILQDKPCIWLFKVKLSQFLQLDKGL